MRVAVTGATGFLGRNLIPELLAQGQEVRTLTRRPVAPVTTGTTSLPLDLPAAPDTVAEAVDGCDVLIHLAWGGLPNYGSSHHLEHELPLHTSFLSNALRSGVPHVVAAGTCFEYGLAEGLLEETTPARPTTLYAEAKVRLHDAVSSVAGALGGSLTWLRPFYVFGPGQPPTTLWGQLHAAMERGDVEFPMSGGEQTRDYLDVEQIALLMAEISVRAGENSVLNVCSGRPTRIRDLVNSWIAEVGSPIRPALGAIPYSASEPMHAYGSTARLDTFLKHPSIVGR